MCSSLGEYEVKDGAGMTKSAFLPCLNCALRLQRRRRGWRRCEHCACAYDSNRCRTAASMFVAYSLFSFKKR